MKVSLNEVDAMAKKAVRGAGYDWGLAEEAGKAARWLCAHGLDGCGAVVQLLEQVDGTDPRTMAPTDMTSVQSAASGAMCPVMAGAALADDAAALRAGDITYENLHAPVLLLPFAAMAAAVLGEPVTVEWDTVGVCCDAGGLRSDGPVSSQTAQVAQVRVSLGGTQVAYAARITRAEPGPATWSALNSFAHRTYAPATEESRLLGAGAGLSDND